MKSLIVFEVEHGETTDPLDQFIADAISDAEYDNVLKVTGYTMRVDLPSEFVLSDKVVRLAVEIGKP